MPAGFYSEQFSIGSDPVDSHSVIGLCPDHTSDSGAVMIGCKRLLPSFNKVNGLNNSTGEIGMVCVDAGIDNSYANTSACYPGVSLVGADNTRSVLKTGIGVSRQRSKTLKRLVELN
jgi:hypothetical protein